MAGKLLSFLSHGRSLLGLAVAKLLANIQGYEMITVFAVSYERPPHVPFYFIKLHRVGRNIGIIY
jgi:hypothetical protein